MIDLDTSVVLTRLPNQQVSGFDAFENEVDVGPNWPVALDFVTRRKTSAQQARHIALLPPR